MVEYGPDFPSFVFPHFFDEGFFLFPPVGGVTIPTLPPVGHKSGPFLELSPFSPITPKAPSVAPPAPLRFSFCASRTLSSRFFGVCRSESWATLNRGFFFFALGLRFSFRWSPTSQYQEGNSTFPLFLGCFHFSASSPLFCADWVGFFS